jgi:hypothetical protein
MIHFRTLGKLLVECNAPYNNKIMILPNKQKAYRPIPIELGIELASCSRVKESKSLQGLN